VEAGPREAVQVSWRGARRRSKQSSLRRCNCTAAGNVSHFGASENYTRIIELLAEFPEGLSRAQIQDKLDLPAGGDLTTNLHNLESAGFIAGFTPADRPAGPRLMRYVIEDPFMRFYFAFLRPYKKAGASDAHHFTNFVLPSARFVSWLGRAFELLCLQHRERIAALLGFSGIQYRAGPWFRHGRRGVMEGVQLDLVFDRADRVLTVCEAKYRKEPVGVEIIDEMERKLARISEFGARTIQKVLITRSEPTAELQRTSYLGRIIRARELMA